MNPPLLLDLAPGKIDLAPQFRGHPRRLMTLDGLAEAQEIMPGGLISVNDDDDDADGVIDYDDGYDKDGVPGNDDDENMFEDDLVLLTLQSLKPHTLTGP